MLSWPAERIASSLATLPRKKIRSAVADKSAAVLLPLCLDARLRPSVLCCVRAPKLRSHAGEICFPGGRREPQDTSDAAAALRETEEELGLPPSRVEVLGELPPILSNRRMAVTPVVGLVTGDGPGGSLTPASLVLERGEVAAAFTVDLEHLLAPSTLKFHDVVVPRESVPMRIPAFVLAPELARTLPYAEGQERPKHAPTDEVAIWGLTGFILHTFLSLEALGLGLAASESVDMSSHALGRDDTEWRDSGSA